MRAAIYARVSTDRCDVCGKNQLSHRGAAGHRFRGQDPDRQIREMRQYCKQRSWGVREFVDRITGTQLHRPELDRMWDLCRRRLVDVVVVQDLDRLGRSVKQLVISLDDLNTWGVQFVALKRGFDTTTAHGRLMFHIVAAFAEFERALISERVVSALETARTPIALGGRGKILGRPRSVVDGARIVELRARLVPWGAVAEEVGVSVATAKRTLKTALAAQKPPKKRVA